MLRCVETLMATWQKLDRDKRPESMPLNLKIKNDVYYSLVLS